MKTLLSSGVRAGRLLFAFVVIAGAWLAFGSSAAGAQEPDDHDHDHGHGFLHFSHPLVTESPSPDSKLRLDASLLNSDEPSDFRALTIRAEGELAFSKSFSIAVVAPFARITSPRDVRASSLGSVEVSAKAASFAFASSGTLVGGGLSVGLPTGNDAKGIGSGHLYEIAPFIDAAVRRGDVEAVGFLTYSTVVNRNATDENENAVTFDGSLLWRFIPQMEVLGEVTTSRTSGGSEGSYAETFLAPGLKWRPAMWPKVAIGVAAILGIGETKRTNAVQSSAFYHF